MTDSTQTNDKQSNQLTNPQQGDHSGRQDPHNTTITKNIAATSPSKEQTVPKPPHSNFLVKTTGSGVWGCGGGGRRIDSTGTKSLSVQR